MRTIVIKLPEEPQIEATDNTLPVVRTAAVCVTDKHSQRYYRGEAAFLKESAADRSRKNNVSWRICDALQPLPRGWLSTHLGYCIQTLL